MTSTMPRPAKPSFRDRLAAGIRERRNARELAAALATAPPSMRKELMVIAQHRNFIV